MASIIEVCVQYHESNFKLFFLCKNAKKKMHTNLGMPSPFESNEVLSQRQISILQRIAEDFKQENIDSEVLQLIKQESSLSLRALDWLVTNYSKKINVICRTLTTQTMFNIFHNYKVSLTHYRRRNFDPFRRRSRIFLIYDNERLETTVGQCNFLHWAHMNGVLTYAISHSFEIEKDMNMASSRQKAERKKQSQDGVPYKRKELSKAPMTKCQVYKVETHVTFDNSDWN